MIMKRIQYKIDIKMQCKNCGHEGFPYIKMITFKTSNKFSAAAHCQRCGKWIENVRKKDIKTIKIK